MKDERIAPQLGRELRQWRERRRASRRVLAYFTDVHPAVVTRAERGVDLRLSTWERLFEAMGCRIVVGIEEVWGADDCEDDLLMETDRRHWRRVEFLDWRLR